MNPTEQAKIIVSALAKEALSNQIKKRTAVAKMNEWAIKAGITITEKEIDQAIEGAYNECQ